MNSPVSRASLESANADRAYALRMLDALPTKRLTASGWEHIEIVLSALASTLTRQDAEAFGISVGDLEIVSSGSSAGEKFVLVPPAESVITKAALVSDRLR